MCPTAGHILELKLCVASISKNWATERLLEYVDKFVKPKRYAFSFHIGRKFSLFRGVFQEKCTQTTTGKRIAQIVYAVFEGTLINLHG